MSEYQNLSEINENYGAIVFDSNVLTWHLTEKDRKPRSDPHFFIPFLITKICEGYKVYIPPCVFDDFFHDPNKANEDIMNQIWNLGRAISEITQFNGLSKMERKLIINDLSLFEKFEKIYPIGYDDFNILTHAKVLSKTRGSAAIISNDISTLGKACHSIVRKTSLTPEKLGFFYRKGMNIFKDMMYNDRIE